MEIKNSSKTISYSVRVKGVLYTVPVGGYVILDDNLQDEASKAISGLPELSLVYTNDSVLVHKLDDKSKTKGLSAEALHIIRLLRNKMIVLEDSLNRQLSKGLRWTPACGNITTVGGAAIEEVSFPSVTADMTVLATMKAVGAVPVTLIMASAGDGKIVFTFSANPSNDHVINFTTVMQSR